ncbi:hypothetical protein HaLaN_12807, partial [Haematococcus lacustris]
MLQAYSPSFMPADRPKEGQCITYDVGTKNESMEWYDIMAAEAVGDPQRSHYQLTTEKLRAEPKVKEGWRGPRQSGCQALPLLLRR